MPSAASTLGSSAFAVRVPMIKDGQATRAASSSGESLQVLPIANELKTPLIAHAGTEKMTNPVTPWVFNTPPTDRVVAAHLLSVFKKRGITQLALLSAADGFGQSGANVVKELAPKYGVTIARHEEFNRTDADMTAQVLKANKSSAEASGTGRLRSVLVVAQLHGRRHRHRPPSPAASLLCRACRGARGRPSPRHHVQRRPRR